jgi:hypothetical protein
LYFCPSKTSKDKVVGVKTHLRDKRLVSIRQHMSAYVSIHQHTSAYVSIRQHTSAYVSVSRMQMSSGEGTPPRQTRRAVRAHAPAASPAACIRQHTSAYVSIRQQLARTLLRHRQLPAYVSIRQHTPAYVSIRQQLARTLQRHRQPPARRLQRQYFCTSKASKLSTYLQVTRAWAGACSVSTFVLVKPVN